ncbi:hypothetical protein TI39_contig1089g00004 [Zymoseptoria brevis]|uniref:Uncharacterized protein n=1 Tax=Zymoseptoria brevis TaxID=1047168 RepID=A0A0F4GFG2_9PEZI|nr:hypothetical protein TI39_contig1089g00004 [Zymoseptoria brevis]
MAMTSAQSRIQLWAQLRKSADDRNKETALSKIAPASSNVAATSKIVVKDVEDSVESSTTSKGLLDLPVELQTRIYTSAIDRSDVYTIKIGLSTTGKVVHPHASQTYRWPSPNTGDLPPPIVHTCHFIHKIVAPMYYGNNRFTIIQNPSVTQQRSPTSLITTPTDLKFQSPHHIEYEEETWVRVEDQTTEHMTCVSLHAEVQEDGAVRAGQRYFMTGQHRTKETALGQALRVEGSWFDRPGGGKLCMCGKLANTNGLGKGEALWRVLINLYPDSSQGSRDGLVSEEVKPARSLRGASGSMPLKMTACIWCDNMRIERVTNKMGADRVGDCDGKGRAAGKGDSKTIIMTNNCARPATAHKQLEMPDDALLPTCQGDKHPKSAGDFGKEGEIDVVAHCGQCAQQAEAVYEKAGPDRTAQNACIETTLSERHEAKVVKQSAHGEDGGAMRIALSPSIVHDRALDDDMAPIKPRHLLDLAVELQIHIYAFLVLDISGRPISIKPSPLHAMYYGGHDFSITNKLSELRSMKQPSNRNFSLLRRVTYRIDTIWVRTYWENKERATSVELKVNISEDGEVRAKQRYTMKHMYGGESLKLPYQTNGLEECDAWKHTFDGILCLCGKLLKAKEDDHGEVWWNLLVNIFPDGEKTPLGVKSPGSTCFKMKRCSRCKEMRIERDPM